MGYQYPLKLVFKFWTLAPGARLSDQQGLALFYSRQQIFRLKKVINVFTDDRCTQELYTIVAAGHFSVGYLLFDATDQRLGVVKPPGIKSLLKHQAHLEVYDLQQQLTLRIKRQNPWRAAFKLLAGGISIVNIGTMLVRLFLITVYEVTRADGTTDGTLVMRLEKIPALLSFSRKFTIQRLNPMTHKEEAQALLSLLVLSFEGHAG
jgi:hypothetical protein